MSELFIGDMATPSFQSSIELFGNAVIGINFGFNWQHCNRIDASRIKKDEMRIIGNAVTVNSSK